MKSHSYKIYSRRNPDIYGVVYDGAVLDSVVEHMLATGDGLDTIVIELIPSMSGGRKQV